MYWVATGLALGVAGVFAVAALTKVGRVMNLEAALVRLLPRSVWEVRGLDSRLLGRAVVFGELALAAAVVAGLIASFAAPSLLACAAVLGAFTLVRERARRLGTPCSCTGLTRAPTNQADVGRIAALAGAAIFAALENPTVTGVGASAWAGTVLVALATLAVAFIPELRTLTDHLKNGERLTAQRDAATQAIASRCLSRRQFVGATAMSLLATSLSWTLDIPKAAHAEASANNPCLLLLATCEECCRGSAFPEACDACCFSCMFCCETGLPPHCEAFACEGCWDMNTTHR